MANFVPSDGCKKAYYVIYPKSLKVVSKEGLRRVYTGGGQINLYYTFQPYFRHCGRREISLSQKFLLFIFSLLFLFFLACRYLYRFFSLS